MKRKSTLVSLLALTFLVSLVSCSVSDKPVPVKAGTDRMRDNNRQRAFHEVR